MSSPAIIMKTAETADDSAEKLGPKLSLVGQSRAQLKATLTALRHRAFPRRADMELDL